MGIGIDIHKADWPVTSKRENWPIPVLPQATGAPLEIRTCGVILNKSVQHEEEAQLQLTLLFTM